MRQPWFITDRRGGRMACRTADDVGRRLGDMIGTPVSRAAIYERRRWLYFAMIQAGVALIDPNLPLGLQFPWPRLGPLHEERTSPHPSHADCRLES